MPKGKPSPLVKTICHSTRTFEEFIHLLQAYGATCVVDMRIVPPWRCHRSLIPDDLPVREIHTEDILSATRRQVHTLTPFAPVRHGDHISG